MCIRDSYDTISAFIKSMRGSDPDAAVYYLARMIYAGEDVKFIARRIMICAAEDVGNADPQALNVAVSAALAAERLGLPEARIVLSQAATYVACAPKSNAAYEAIDKALDTVRSTKTPPVPNHLRDSHYKGAGKLGHGQGYLYAHSYPHHYVKQQYRPDGMAVSYTHLSTFCASARNFSWTTTASGGTVRTAIKTRDREKIMTGMTSASTWRRRWRRSRRRRAAAPRGYWSR